MTPASSPGAALRAALLERLLAEGLSVDAALERARLTMAWVERGEGPLALPKPAQPAAGAKAGPANSPPAFAPDGASAGKPRTQRAPRVSNGDGRRRAWSAEDDAELKRAWGRESLAALAARLGRKYSTVYGRARELGLPPLGPSRHQRGGRRPMPLRPRPLLLHPTAPSLRSCAAATTPSRRGPRAAIASTAAWVTRAELIAIANRQCRKLGRPEFTVAA